MGMGGQRRGRGGQRRGGSLSFDLGRKKRKVGANVIIIWMTRSGGPVQYWEFGRNLKCVQNYMYAHHTFKMSPNYLVKSNTFKACQMNNCSGSIEGKQCNLNEMHKTQHFTRYRCNIVQAWCEQVQHNLSYAYSGFCDRKSFTQTAFWPSY